MVKILADGSVTRNYPGDFFLARRRAQLTGY